METDTRLGGLPRRPLLVLALVAAATHAAGVANGFVWLDHVEILEAGYRVTSAADVWRAFTLTLDQYLARFDGAPPSAGGYWRPVYALSISLDWWLWGDCAACYHLENVAWHVVVVVLLYLLGRHVLGTWTHAPATAFWAAALFAAHPLATTSVTWVSGRKDSLCAALATAAILAFARLARSADRPAAWGWSIACLLSFTLALGVKESALVVPAFVLLLWWQLRPETRRPGHLAGTLAGIWLIAGALVAYRESALGGFGLNARYPGESLQENLATAADLLREYLTRIALPQPTRLSDTWVVADGLTLASVLTLTALVFGAVAGAWMVLRRHPAGLAVAWFYAWLAPVSGLVPLRHLFAERYLYPASWGLLLLLCGGALVLTSRVRVPARGAGHALLGGMVLLCGVVTASGSRLWRDDATLFGDAVARHPEYLEGRSALARDALARGDYAGAIHHSQALLTASRIPRLRGYWSPFVTYSNLGVAHYRRGELAAADSAFASAVRYAPLSATANYQAGLTAQALGRLDTARARYLAALRAQPDHFEARSNLAVVLMHSGQVDAAEKVLRALVAEHPGDVTNRINLVSALLVRRDCADAVPLLRGLLADAPGLAVQRARLAYCQWQAGDAVAARRNALRALREAPEDPSIRVIADTLGIPLPDA